MSPEHAMLYGWLFFSVFGGACGFVLGWTACARAAIAKAATGERS